MLKLDTTAEPRCVRLLRRGGVAEEKQTAQLASDLGYFGTASSARAFHALVLQSDTSFLSCLPEAGGMSGRLLCQREIAGL